VHECQQPLVVAVEEKPPTLPPLIRPGEGGRDVQLRPVRAQLECAAAGSDGVAHPLHLAREGEHLRPEEMEPQVLLGLDPQVPLLDGDEDGCLGDGVRVEVVQLHPVVVQQRQHEAACWNSKSPLMERGEGHHIARERRWHLLVAYHSGYGLWEQGQSRPTSTNTSKSSSVMEEMGHGSRGGRTLIFLTIGTK
jgi:hypothetical protein